MKALQDLGHTVTPIDTEPAEVTRKQSTLLYRIRRRILGPEDFAGANQQIIAAIRKNAYDLVWIDKGLKIEREALLAVKQNQPGCRVVGYSPDDMTGPFKQSSRAFLRHLDIYDCFLTTKTYNVSRS